MKRMDRREFIKTGVAGLAGFTVIQSGCGIAKRHQDKLIDVVPLGKTGLMVSRLAFGTGTSGRDKSSNQTRKGMDHFLSLAHHAYERGVRFYDTADLYGSMPFIGEAIKSQPREKITILSKLWTQADNTENLPSLSEHIDRFRKELGVEYIDVLLMHCMTRGGWSTNRTHFMDGFSKAKQAGIVKAIGISSHNKEALIEAADHPWVDVIMERINPFGTAMDGTPDEVSKILAKARANGKGIIGMKIYGEGKHVLDEEREKSVRYAFKEASVHCITLGFESIDQMNDGIEQVLAV
jgi:aryl-alcohol dehydrogenase-like predicted oxidoreductase